MKNPKKMINQHEHFAKKACELGCDEDEKVFDDKLRRIGKAPPHKADEKDKTPDK